MRPKTNEERFDDSIDYLQNKVDFNLAKHILGLVANPQLKSSIGAQLHLGSRWPRLLDREYDAHTQQRRALRALLLCQRVYFSDLWYWGSPGQASDLLKHTPDWSDTSVDYWHTKTELQIKEGISTFLRMTENAHYLAYVARKGKPGVGSLPALTLTRSDFSHRGLPSCYGAVITWLFQSGLFSYRWYLRHACAGTKASLMGTFGQPCDTLWNSQAEFTEQDPLRDAPCGHIVHLYATVGGLDAWKGHWMVSLGNGFYAGCNNSAEQNPQQIVTARPDYSSQCTLKKQLVGIVDARHNQAGQTISFRPARVDVYNPAWMPDRL